MNTIDMSKQTTARSAMKLALEAIESAIKSGDWKVDGACDPDMAIVALRDALSEQAAQPEPVLQDIEQYRLQMAGISTAAIGYWKEGDGILPDYDTIALRDVAKLYAKYDELYRAQRTWVGLTDEELEQCDAHETWRSMRNVEAKLKEKNT